MLIEFSVENHRTFREKQTFTMVASTAAGRNAPEEGPKRVADTGFKAVPHALRTACLFGANGSGKSSLIDAMAFMSRFVRTSFRNEPGKAIKVEPFVFHSDWREAPSEFEAIFIAGETLYQYGFALTKTRVVEEWLFARPKSTGRQRQLFTRSYDADKDAYDWDISSVHVKGERDSWKAQTRPDALFLSTAVQLNADGLREAFEWLAAQFEIFPTAEEMSEFDTSKRFDKEDWKDRIMGFLGQADISVQDIAAEKYKVTEHFRFKSLPEVLQEVISETLPENATAHDISFLREDNTGSLIPLPLEEESDGTRALFKLAGPILDVLENGYTVVVDELNTGLHPLAFEYIVSLFCDPKTNPHNAQLIFTSHDTSMLDSACIGRDQIWLVDKARDLAASLTPLSDFKPRHDAAGFQKRYLEGRFGGVPRLTG